MMEQPFETEFTRAWDTPGHTRYQLPDTDINRVLTVRYTTGTPLAFTRSMLWDMESHKAAHPGARIQRWRVQSLGVAGLRAGLLRSATERFSGLGPRQPVWAQPGGGTPPAFHLTPGVADGAGGHRALVRLTGEWGLLTVYRRRRRIRLPLRAGRQPG